jgi:phosphatidylserine decarboxylase
VLSFPGIVWPEPTVDTLFIWLQHLLPQHLLSRMLGRLADAQTPRDLVQWIIRRFVARFGVDMSEAADSDLTSYRSFNEFFTRPLRDGIRPIAAEPTSLCSPADGCISQIGQIQDGRILQAKGRGYSVSALLGGDAERAERFVDGHFATVYLSPRDYHRVHMPLRGRLLATRYVPGDLFSVNGVTADRVEHLFARNERLVCHFETDAGPLAMVLVGAMIVAGIETVWSGQEVPVPRQITERNFSDPPQPVLLEKGAEMGRFRLGSTVILLFGRDAIAWQSELRSGSALRMGAAIGTVNHPA